MSVTDPFFHDGESPLGEHSLEDEEDEEVVEEEDEEDEEDEVSPTITPLSNRDLLRQFAVLQTQLTALHKQTDHISKVLANLHKAMNKVFSSSPLWTYRTPSKDSVGDVPEETIDWKKNVFC
jgi:hypothetical protein